MVNPYSAYKKSSVSTMTPVEVVIKLYAEIEFLFGGLLQLIEQVLEIEKNVLVL